MEARRKRGPGRSRTIAQLVFGVGAGIAGTVYGTIVVMAALTAAYATEKRPWILAAIVSSTALVLWAAHVYAHGLSESIMQSRRLTWNDVRSTLRRELGILLAAVVPTAVLVLAALGLLAESTAVWLAIVVCLVTLASEGVRYAHVAGLGRAGTLAATSINVALGLVMVVLKVLVAH